MNQSDDSFDDLLAQLDTNASGPSARVTSNIRQQCAGNLEPTSSMSRTTRVLLCAALALAVVLSLAFAFAGDGVHEITVGAIYGTAGWATVMLGVLAAGFGNQRAGNKLLRVGLALGVPLLYFVYLTLCRTGWLPLNEFLTHDTHCAQTLNCGAMALMLGAVSSAGVLYVWRRSDPFNPTLSGALAGLIGGLAGALSTGLICPGSEGWHLWLGHGLSVLALVVLGSLLGRRVLAP